MSVVGGSVCLREASSPTHPKVSTDSCFIFRSQHVIVPSPEQLRSCHQEEDRGGCKPTSSWQKRELTADRRGQWSDNGAKPEVQDCLWQLRVAAFCLQGQNRLIAGNACRCDTKWGAWREWLQLMKMWISKTCLSTHQVKEIMSVEEAEQYCLVQTSSWKTRGWWLPWLVGTNINKQG